jgi:polar amino acid transport system substrate-binding protein
MKKSLLLIITITFAHNCAAQTLRLVTEDFPPYQITVKGKLVAGRSFLLVDELLKRAQIDSQIEVLPWARAHAIASSGQNVMIFSMARTASREAYFNWLIKIDSLAFSFYRLATRQELQVQSLSEILKYAVATVRNSSEANSLIEMGFVEGENLILTVSDKEALEMVLLKRADFIYGDSLIQDAIYEANAGDPALFSKSYDPGESSDLYLATSININTGILHRLKNSLKSMQQDGTVAKILPRRD